MKLLLILSFLIWITKSEEIEMSMDIYQEPINNSEELFERKDEDLDIGGTSINFKFIVKLKLGTPQQQFRVLIDTGSTWLWVGDKNMPFQNTFSCDESESCNLLDNSNTNISYASSKASGYIAKDTLAIGDEYTIKGVEFIIVNQTKQIEQFQADGILGLGYMNIDQYNSSITSPTSSFSSSSSSSILDILKEQNFIQSKSFSIYLHPHFLKTSSISGNLRFGSYDRKYIDPKQEFYYVRVDDDKYWATSLGDAFVDGISLEYLDDYKAIFDSGTNTIALPKAIFDKFFENMEMLGFNCEYENNLMECECDSGIDSFPKFEVELGEGRTFELPPRFYVIKQSDKCIPMVQKLQISKYVILGHPFLQYYYTYFDKTNGLIGIVKSMSADKQILAEHKMPSNQSWNLFLIFVGLILFGILYFYCSWEKVKKTYQVCTYYREPDEEQESFNMKHRFRQMAFEIQKGN